MGNRLTQNRPYRIKSSTIFNTGTEFKHFELAQTFREILGQLGTKIALIWSSNSAPVLTLPLFFFAQGPARTAAFDFC